MGYSPEFEVWRERGRDLLRGAIHGSAGFRGEVCGDGAAL